MKKKRSTKNSETTPSKKNSTRGERSIRILPGQYFDAETGLFYNGARYYDPRTGRYISSDPMSVGEHVRDWMVGLHSFAKRNNSASLGDIAAFVAGEMLNLTPLDINSFTYANNNPLRFIDPLGLSSEPSSSEESDPRSPENICKLLHPDSQDDYCELRCHCEHKIRQARCGAGVRCVNDSVLKEYQCIQTCNSGACRNRPRFASSQ